MSKYTAEQVRDIHWKMAKDYKRIPALAEPHKDMGDAINALLRERESAKAAGPDYTPGNLDRTAPAKIWLQINTDGDSSDRDEPWPGADAVTWQDEPIGGLEIQYVRADLVNVQVPEGYRLQPLSEYDAMCAVLAAAPKPETEEREMDSNQPILLKELYRSANNFRFMMNTFADAYVEAITKGNKEAMFRAIRAYVDLAEVSTPDRDKRELQP